MRTAEFMLGVFISGNRMYICIKPKHMTKELQKTVKMSCGHEMTEDKLNSTILLMINKLYSEGIEAVGTITIPDADITLEVSHYDDAKFRHAMSSFRYKIVGINGSYISLNLY